MALVLYSRCCTSGYRYQGGAWPTICPQCRVSCDDWTAATVDDPAIPYEVSDRGVRILRALWIDPERPLDVSREEE